MKAKIDKDLCIGCGLCSSDCPEVFAMNDENTADVIVDTVPAELKEQCRATAGNCPVEAIKIID
jgi:ferredoxin